MNTTPLRPTPETDVVVANDTGDNGFLDEIVKTCRRLERERDEAREDTPWHFNGETKDEWFARAREKCAVLERERDEAREQLEAMRDELQKVCQRTKRSGPAAQNSAI